MRALSSQRKLLNCENAAASLQWKQCWDRDKTESELTQNVMIPPCKDKWVKHSALDIFSCPWARLGVYEFVLIFWQLVFQYLTFTRLVRMKQLPYCKSTNGHLLHTSEFKLIRDNFKVLLLPHSLQLLLSSLRKQMLNLVRFKMSFHLIKLAC